MNKKLSPEVIKFLENTCIFCQPWWLEAVSPGCWDIAVVKRGYEIAAVWPYTYKKRLGKYRLQDLPLIYSYSGPWLRTCKAKYSKQLSEEKQLMTELIENLPPFAVFNQWFHPSITNWLPFFWNGFKQTTRYTYLIDPKLSLDQIWDATKANIRTDIRKAEKQVEIIEENEIRRFLNLQHITFNQHGLKLPYPERMLLKIEDECSKRGLRKILLAVDSQNRIHAGAYLVWDTKCVYAILRGSDRELPNSGASSLILWKAIEFANKESKNFDFAGSWNKAIEKFISAFGARQVPFYEISKTESKLVQAYRLIRRYIF